MHRKSQPQAVCMLNKGILEKLTRKQKNDFFRKRRDKKKIKFPNHRA